MFWIWQPSELELLPAVLSRARPAHLKLSGTSFLLDHPSAGLTALAKSGEFSYLESLVLQVTLRRDGRDEDISAKLVSSLRSSRAVQ